MSKLIYSALAAFALFVSASQAIARPSSTPDTSDEYGGYAHNSPEGNRAFWEYRARHGGN